MSTRDRTHDSDDKLAALHERLAEQVKALRSGEDWMRWLDVARRFRTYSFHNTLLILSQQPDAERVAGYRAWQALGRQVNKGEKGIQILAPILRRGSEVSDEDEHDPARRRTRLAGYRVTHVWSESQTSGDPLPEQPTPELLTGEAPPLLWNALADLITDQGFTLDRGDCRGANGFTHFGERTVRVRDDVDDAQAVKTLAHELAHVLLHDPGSATATSVDCRGVVEVEAESVAYLVGSSHGLATDSYSFAYVTGWAAAVPGSTPEDVVAATGQRVLTAARSILASTLDEPQATPEAAAALAERADAALRRSRAVRDRAEAQPSHADAVPGRHQRERLLAVHADAQAFFEERVLSSWVPAYVESRGLGGALDVSSPWRLGYAPPGWTELTRHLQDAGYSDDTLEASGICVRARTGRLVDRFRDRLTLPIRDPEGRVIAFIGRTGPGSDPKAPRYLNSPETPLFTKGAVLFGTAEGRLAWQSGATPVLVEGPLDAMAVSLATEGKYAGMAPCGTALSCTQARALAEAAALGGRLVVALDADPAGRSATAKAFEWLPKSGLRLEVAELPPGSDPADLLKTAGPGPLGDALDTSRPLIDAVVDHKLDAHTGRLQWAEGRVAAVRAVTPLIASLAPLDAVRQVRRVAELTGLPVATVSNELLDNLARPEQATLPRARGPSSPRLTDALSTPPRRSVPVVHRPRR